MNKTKSIGSLEIGICVMFIFILSVSGCSWQRIPNPPVYDVPRPIQLRIGVELGNTPASQVYGHEIINHLKEMRVFDQIIYPYREDDTVDGVLKITITGGWKVDKAGEFIKGFIIGLSLFTLSPVVGVDMTGTHDANIMLYKGSTEIIYSVNVVTKVSWGLAANTSEVGVKSDAIQKRKIAVEIAKRINEDRLRISKEFGK